MFDIIEKQKILNDKFPEFENEIIFRSYNSIGLKIIISLYTEDMKKYSVSTGFMYEQIESSNINIIGLEIDYLISHLENIIKTR